jgi:alpha-glucosidase
VWTWLRGDLEIPYFGLPVTMPRLGGDASTATMRAFRAGVPWSFVLHSWAILDSHDTPRFRTMTGSEERQLVGAGLQLTTPGVPMLFAGDELGMEGKWGEDARRPIQWDEPLPRLFEQYRRLIALRRSSAALARGSLRYAYVDEDVIAYVRETRTERLLCLASRAPHEPVRLPLRTEETLYGEDPDGDRFPADGPSFHVWRVTNG